jgi:hypothetical protein
MAEKDSLRLIIAGAGIAGLAAAIALKRVSEIPHLDIQLYEQAPELLEIGASIALSPNVRCLISINFRTYLSSGLHRACALWRNSVCTRLLRMKWATEDQVGFRRFFGKICLLQSIWLG